MARKSKQGGLTLIGFVVVISVLGLFFYVGMKLFPVYQEYYAVVTAMKGVQAKPASPR